MTADLLCLEPSDCFECAREIRFEVTRVQIPPKPTAYSRGIGQEPVTGRITGTIDGNTIVVLTAGQQLIKIELAFVDCAEMNGSAVGPNKQCSCSRQAWLGHN